jgi:hypothetical protein
MKENILTKTAIEYFLEGNEALSRERYNSAAVLFFKALVGFSDLYIFKKTGQIPSSHSNRFSLAKLKFPEVYDLLDKDFPFYQDSYTKIISKELAEVIKNDAQDMAKKVGIEV